MANPAPGDQRTLDDIPLPLFATSGLAQAPAQPQTASGRLLCPYCVTPPELEVFRRYENVTYEPLRFCPRCYGFWAARDSLARGVADPGQEHPALRAVPLPPRCRSCAGLLDEDETCRDCGKKLPLMDCPSCGKQMKRTERANIKLDACGDCHGVWFDGGEINATFNIPAPEGWASRNVESDAEGTSDASLFMEAARILLTLFLPI
jgi:Zn-finger nucleic acid-binding protein